jgi:hypothetical protein
MEFANENRRAENPGGFQRAPGGSHLAAVEQKHVGAAGCERLHVGRRSLPLRTRESSLYRGQIVEV